MYLDPETLVEIKLPESTQSFKVKVGGVDWFLLAMSYGTVKYRVVSEPESLLDVLIKDIEETVATPLKYQSEVFSKEFKVTTDNYVKAVRCLTSDTTVSYNIFINPKGVEITEDKRTSETLKKSGISMKNIKGDYIK